jgi:hypothetical protein
MVHSGGPAAGRGDIAVYIPILSSALSAFS